MMSFAKFAVATVLVATSLMVVAASPHDARAISDSAPSKLQVLYVGTVSNCNAGVVSNHASHENCSSRLIGYTSSYDSKTSSQRLYFGTTRNVNAGIVFINGGDRGGASQEIGWTLKDDSKLQGSVQLYYLADDKLSCSRFYGEVTTNSNHRNCHTYPIGWTYPADSNEKPVVNLQPELISLCRGSTWPTGYIRFGADHADTCGNTSLFDYNRFWLVRYSNKPVGYFMTVCADFIPLGWIQISEEPAAGTFDYCGTGGTWTIRKVS